MTGNVIAFEPVPENIDCIKSHISENNLGNIELENFVVSDLNGLINFTIEKNNANSHIADIEISHMSTNVKKILNLQQVTLDSYMSEMDIHPNVIKIDVEGAEVKVLRGALNTLKIDKPLIIVSIHSKECYEGCMQIFNSLNYKVINLEGFEHELCCYPR